MINDELYTDFVSFCKQNELYDSLHSSTHAVLERDVGGNTDKEVKQNPYHKEGSIINHINMVYEQACMTNSKYLKMLALTHDLGKPFVRYVKHFGDKPSRVFFSGHHYASALLSIYFIKKYFNIEESNYLLKLICQHMENPILVSNEKERYWGELLQKFQECDDRGRITELNLSSSKLSNVSPRERGDGKTVTFMIGIPGCGKSTIAKTYYYGKIFSTDQYLLNIANLQFGIKDYNEAFKKLSEEKINWKEQAVKDMIECSKTEDVIFDATNLTRKGRMGIINRLPKGTNVKYVLVWRELNKCVKSCMDERESGKTIPMDVLKGMLYSFSYPSPEEYNELVNFFI